MFEKHDISSHCLVDNYKVYLTRTPLKAIFRNKTQVLHYERQNLKAFDVLSQYMMPFVKQNCRYYLKSWSFLLSGEVKVKILFNKYKFVCVLIPSFWCTWTDYFLCGIRVTDWLTCNWDPITAILASFQRLYVQCRIDFI